MIEFLRDITIATFGALWWIFKSLVIAALVVGTMLFVIITIANWR